MTRWDPPVVAVQHPHERRIDQGTGASLELVALTDALYVFCTDCGDVTDWTNTTDAERHRLQREAADHANVAHDGLVDAVGWVR